MKTMAEREAEQLWKGLKTHFALKVMEQGIAPFFFPSSAFNLPDNRSPQAPHLLAFSFVYVSKQITSQLFVITGYPRLSQECCRKQLEWVFRAELEARKAAWGGLVQGLSTWSGCIMTDVHTVSMHIVYRIYRILLLFLFLTGHIGRLKPVNLL